MIVDEQAIQIDGFGPLPVLRPTSVAQLCELVRRASSRNEAIYPTGGRTMLNIGLPPCKPGVAVDLRALDQVIDYPARDMTVTVQAGITIAKLQEVLARENQCLPIDVPNPEQATLGGAIATNTSGPRRLGYGTLRDYVIGISVVNDEGQETKAGGRVVKNVAGYDMMKLHSGALGTLGIVTQVTLKLRPLPDSRSATYLGYMVNSVGPLLDRLHQSRTRPVALELLNGAAVRYAFGTESPWAAIPTMAIIGYEANKEALSWQLKQITDEVVAHARDPDIQLAFVVTQPELSWGTLTDFAAMPRTVLSFKANLLPSALAEFWSLAESSHPGLALQAHAGNGIVIGHATGDLTLDEASEILTTLGDTAARAQGNIVILRCPPEWKQNLPVWGKPRGDAWLMRDVKRQLDPKGIFNPGRFVDGI